MAVHDLLDRNPVPDDLELREAISGNLCRCTGYGRILQAARTTTADLIIMATEGPDGFLEGLRGSTSQRVLSGSPCPLAILPAGSMLD